MTIGIYGLGRFGLFWARFLAEHFPVKVFSRTRRETLAPGLAWAEEAEVCGTDALFFCVSNSAFEDVLKRVRARVRARAAMRRCHRQRPGGV